MEAGQFASEIEAEARAGDLTEGSQPAESNEEPAHVLGGDTDALVANAEDGQPAHRRHLCRHIPARRRVFDRIIDQVAHHDLQPHWIAEHPEFVADAVIEAQAMLRRGVWLRIRQAAPEELAQLDRKSTRLNSSHLVISYAVFCL